MVLTDVVRRLLDAVSDVSRITSILLHGGPGVGKTSAIDCMCHEIQSRRPGFRRKKEVLTLNASDDRGLDTVRTTITAFVAHSQHTPKILVLDEIDAMTLAAQRTLATVVREHKAVLLATCNYLYRVDTALRDTCILVQMPAPDKELSIDRLVSHTSVPRPLAERVYHDAKGDLRTAKNYCGLLRSLPADTDLLTPEQRLTLRVTECCKNHAATLARRPELCRELATLLMAGGIASEHRTRAYAELEAMLSATLSAAGAN
jgi:DNA polymerase III delta prime subunit